MIVSCDRCASRYRINEAKLPPGGGNIKCPSCEHVFFVKPVPSPSDVSALPRRPDGAIEEPEAAASSPQVGTMPSMLLNTQGQTPSLQGSGDGSISQDPATSPPSGDTSEGAGGERATWKLKTSFGLIYDFPDATSLRNWLTGREDLAGYQLSRDGRAFEELASFPEVLTPELEETLQRGGDQEGKNAPARDKRDKPEPSPAPEPESPGAAAGSSPGSEPGDDEADPHGRPTKRQRSLPSTSSMLVEPSKRATEKRRAASSGPSGANPRPKRRPPASTSSGSSPWVIAVSVVLAVLLVGLFLQLFEVVDFRALVTQEGAQVSADESATGSEAKQETGGEQTAAVSDEAAPSDRKAEEAAPTELSHQQLVADLLEKADDQMYENKYEEAVETLDSARSVAPNNPKIYDKLESAYSRMGRHKEARQARRRAAALEKQVGSR